MSERAALDPAPVAEFADVPGPEAERCRRLFRMLAAGVSIVSAQGPGGPVGMTASSVTSVSLHPPLLSAYLATGSGTLAALRRTRAFGVQFLAAEQQSLAEDFAGRGGHRFEGADYTTVLGVPILRGTLAWSVCLVDDVRRYGDHALVVGRIVATHTGEGTPLLWHDRRFNRLQHQVGPVPLAR